MYLSNQEITNKLLELAGSIYNKKFQVSSKQYGPIDSQLTELAGDVLNHIQAPNQDYNSGTFKKLETMIKKVNAAAASFKGDEKNVVKEMLQQLDALQKGIQEEMNQKQQMAQKNLKAQVIPCRVDFKSEENPNGPSNTQQARAFLDYAKELTKDNDKKVGLTYSANDRQSARIHAENNKGGQVNFKNYGIEGRNQAEVMMEIEKLLKTDEYKGLNGKFVILPVTTCTKNSLNKTEKTNKNLITRDLNQIDDFLQKGNTVLAWKNQTTKENEVAIGGGVEARIKGKDGAENKNLIAEAKKVLAGFAEKYPAPPVNLTSSVKNNAQQEKAPQKSDKHDTKWIINSGLHLSKIAIEKIKQHKDVLTEQMKGQKNPKQDQTLKSQPMEVKPTREMPPLPDIPSSKSKM